MSPASAGEADTAPRNRLWLYSSLVLAARLVRRFLRYNIPPGMCCLFRIDQWPEQTCTALRPASRR
jgi:hypothetical protein